MDDRLDHAKWLEFERDRLLARVKELEGVKVELPRLLEAVGSAPGPEERKAMVDALTKAESERDRYKAALDSERQHLLERCYLELYVSSHDEREHKREDCLQAARAMANRIAEIDMGIR